MTAEAGRTGRQPKATRTFVVLMGAPGAGKGTQADQLADARGLCKLSTGDLLRDAIRAGSELGRAAEDRMRQGVLVDDETILGLVREELGTPRCVRGAVLDGFPRTLGQAEGLDRLLTELGERIARVVFIDVDEDEVVRRLSSRRICSRCGRIQQPAAGDAAPGGPGTSGRKETGGAAVCDSCGGELIQRPDDQPDTIRHRLQVFRDQTAPLLKWFDDRRLLRRVNGGGEAEAVHGRVMEELE